MNKQTVYKGTGHKSWDGKFEVHSDKNSHPQFANELRDVYVLSEEEIKIILFNAFSSGRLCQYEVDKGIPEEHRTSLTETGYIEWKLNSKT